MMSQLIPANNGCVQVSHGSHVQSVDRFVKLVNSQQLIQIFTPPHSIQNIIVQESAPIP